MDVTQSQQPPMHSPEEIRRMISGMIRNKCNEYTIRGGWRRKGEGADASSITEDDGGQGKRCDLDSDHSRLRIYIGWAK